MRYMLFLHNSSYQPKDNLWLKNKARTLSSASGITIRDTRVSKSHIEYDINIPDDSEIVEVAAMLRDIGPYADSYQVIEKKREKIQAISEATRFFNEEKYWIAHEILEYVWKGSTGAERELIGGIILVCAAFVHYQKDEEEICISILGRALKKLTTTTDRIYYGTDIEVIKNHISDIISENKVEPFKISQS
jgi:uncharacterized protein